MPSSATASRAGPFDAWRAWSANFDQSAKPDHVALETDNYHAAMSAVSRGDGICLGVVPFINPWLASGRVRAVDRFRCTLDQGAYLVYSPHREHDPQIARLFDWLVTALA